MPIYEVFTQICVLQEFREKKQKSTRKQSKVIRNSMSRHHVKNVATSVEVRKTEKFNVVTSTETSKKCHDVKARIEEQRHQKQCRDISSDIDIRQHNIRSSNVTTSNQCRDIG